MDEVGGGCGCWEDHRQEHHIATAIIVCQLAIGVAILEISDETAMASIKLGPPNWMCVPGPPLPSNSVVVSTLENLLWTEYPTLSLRWAWLQPLCP